MVKKQTELGEGGGGGPVNRNDGRRRKEKEPRHPRTGRRQLQDMTAAVPGRTTSLSAPGLLTNHRGMGAPYSISDSDSRKTGLSPLAHGGSLEKVNRAGASGRVTKPPHSILKAA